MSNPDYKDEAIERFITRLSRASKGTINALNRVSGQNIEDAPHVLIEFYQLVPPGTPVFLENTLFLVATLYKKDSSATTGHSLGWYAGMTARAAKSDGIVSKRFEVLLDSDEDQMPYQLSSFVRLLVGMGAKIDWKRLAVDLSNWNSEKRYIQKTWAREFFNPNTTTEQSA